MDEASSHVTTLRHRDTQRVHQRSRRLLWLPAAVTDASAGQVAFADGSPIHRREGAFQPTN